MKKWHSLPHPSPLLGVILQRLLLSILHSFFLAVFFFCPFLEIMLVGWWISYIEPVTSFSIFLFVFLFYFMRISPPLSSNLVVFLFLQHILKYPFLRTIFFFLITALSFFIDGKFFISLGYRFSFGGIFFSFLHYLYFIWVPFFSFFVVIIIFPVRTVVLNPDCTL